MIRRLAGIMIADVVGFSRLMEADEAGALEALKARWTEVLEPVTAARGGRIVKYMGDGVLVEFASVVSALEAALALGEGMAAADEEAPEDQRIRLRIGVNFGDVIGEGEDIYGDGVNVAARLEPLAEPGGICVSAKVRDEVREALDCVFEDLGEQSLKNISRPVRVFRVRPAGAGSGSAPEPAPAAQLALPDRPSIAVVPFQNMSADPEQEYFADGMVEDIITELARFKWLFVISRNSSFAYKAANIDIKRVGRELGVRYVLEGSVRKAGLRLRITGQLIDAATGAHLWADRFDGALEDVFELQDQVTSSVVGAIAPRLEQAEMERARRKPVGSLDAYDHHLRGLAAFNRFSREGNDEALAEFAAARRIDASFAPALGMAARAYGQRLGFGWLDDPEADAAKALRLAREAAHHGANDAAALANAGFACILFGALEDGDSYLDRALDMSPNFAGAWHVSGLAKALIGQVELTEERGLRSIRLSPQDPQNFAMLATVGLGRLLTGDADGAWVAASEAFRTRPGSLFTGMVAAASAARVGRTEDARRAVAKIMESDPSFTRARLRKIFDFRREEHFRQIADPLVEHGLPE